MRIFLLTAAFLLAPGALAQSGAPLQPGEVIESGGGQQVKVLQCRATAYRWRECEVVLWKGGAAGSNPSWSNEEDLLKWDGQVRAARNMPSRRGASTAAATARPQAAVPTQPAATTGRIPDGTYKCQIWMGNSYVSLGTVTSVNGSLNTGLLAKVGATFTGATPTATGVTINYKTARGYNESMDCAR